MNSRNQLTEVETKEFAESAFTAMVPGFSFSVNGTQVVIRIAAIVGADRYEVYQGNTAKGKYELIVSGGNRITIKCVRYISRTGTK